MLRNTEHKILTEKAAFLCRIYDSIKAMFLNFAGIIRLGSFINQPSGAFKPLFFL